MSLGSWLRSAWLFLSKGWIRCVRPCAVSPSCLTLMLPCVQRDMSWRECVCLAVLRKFVWLVMDCVGVSMGEHGGAACGLADVALGSVESG